MSPDTAIYVKIGGKKYTLPVNPENISVTHPYVDKTAEIAGVGEVLIPQKPGLREITFESFFPGNDDPYVHDYRNPRTLAKAFERAWKNRTKCRLIIARSIDYDTNIQCVISDWKVEDRGGEPDDLYYSVTFREYRSYGVSQMTVVDSTGSAVTGPGANLTPADGALSQKITVSTENIREMDTAQMVVGASISLNGTYYADPEATEAVGTASGDTATLTRIDSVRSAPYYVKGFGWLKANAVLLMQNVNAAVEEQTSPWAKWGL